MEDSSSEEDQKETDKESGVVGSKVGAVSTVSVVSAGGTRTSRRKKKNTWFTFTNYPLLAEWSTKVETIVEDPRFSNFIIAFICLNTTLLAAEHYDMPGWLKSVSDVCNIIFTLVFFVEMVLKLFGLGIKKYISDNFNVFDCVIVLVSMIELVLASDEKSGLSVLRAFRLLRVFKIIKSWTSLRILLNTVLESMSAIANLGFLTLLYLFISSLLAKQFFSQPLLDSEGEVSRYSFISTERALVTIFIVLTGENWNEIMI